MTIELGVSSRSLVDLFDSKQVTPGMSREIPGVGTLKLGATKVRDSAPSVQATAFVTIVLTLGKTVVKAAMVKLLADFLTQKLKGEDKERRMMTVNRKIVEVTTAEAMVRVLEETIAIDVTEN